MNILIIGKTGTGKSNLVDIIRSTIFRVDPDAKIETNDPGRSIKVFGKGGKQYNVNTKQVKNNNEISLFEIDNNDVLIIMCNDNFYKWFHEIYNK